MPEGRRLVVLIRPQSNLVDRALRSRMEFAVLTDPARVSDSMFRAPRGCHVVNLADHDALVLLARSLAIGFDDVLCLSLNEPDLVTAALINAELGSVWNPVEVVTTCTNKQALREGTGAIDGVADTRWMIVKDVADLRRACDALGVPLVLKPLVGAGGRGVVHVEDVARAEALWAVGPQAPLLAEEYIDGPEYTVETFSVSARHQVVAIVDKVQFSKRSGHFVSSRHTVPARLGPRLSARLEQAAVNILDRLRLQQGPSHIQLRIRDDDVYLIEVHCRVSGDEIPEAVWQVTGWDLYEMTLALAEQSLMEPVEKPVANSAACVQYFHAEPGTVRRVVGFEVARRAPGVVHALLNADVGDKVPPIEWAGDRLGYVMAIGGSAAEAEERCAMALAMVEIDMTDTDD